MKKIVLLIVCFALSVTPALSQEMEITTESAREESVAETSDTEKSDVDPGLSWLDEAVEEKLNASTPQDALRVIALARRAKKEGLSGENLKFCDELIASELLRRGMNLSATLVGQPPERLPQGWKNIRTRILDDLETAVEVIKDQPTAYLRIAQLHALPDGDAKRLEETLKLAEQAAKDDPNIFAQITLIRANLEKDPAKRETLLDEATKKNADPRILMAQVMNLVGQNQIDEALKTLDEILRKNPEDRQALMIKLELLNAHEKNEEALQIIDLLLEDEPNDHLALHMAIHRARLLSKLGRNDEAIEALNELREKHPDDPAILLLRAAVFLETKEFEKGLKDIDAGIRLAPDPMDSPLQVLKIQFLLALERYEDAIKLVEEHEDRDDMKSGLIQGLLEKKQYEKAEQLLDDFRKKDPEKKQWILLALMTFAGQEKFDECMELIGKDKTDENDRVGFAFALVQFLMSKEEFDKAEKFLETLRKTEPDKVEWALLAGQFFVDRKQFDKAAEWTEKFVKSHPDVDAVRLFLIAVLADQKKNRRALELLEPLLKNDPNDLRLLRTQGQLLLSSGRHADAIRVMEDIVKKEPEDEVTLNNLSWVLSTSPDDSVRDGKRALELAEKACELTEYQKAYILSTLAAAHAELGDFDKAIEWSEKSLSLSQEDENVAERTDELQKELDSYKEKKPYRELMDDVE